MKTGPNRIDIYVGLRVRHARIEAGLSQEQLAEGLGVTFQQVQKYEKGTNRVAPSRLHIIAAKTGKPIAWFYPEGITTSQAADSHMMVFCQQQDSHRLARAFNKITDPQKRRAVLQVAESMAA